MEDVKTMEMTDWKITAKNGEHWRKLIEQYETHWDMSGYCL